MTKKTDIENSLEKIRDVSKEMNSLEDTKKLDMVIEYFKPLNKQNKYTWDQMDVPLSDTPERRIETNGNYQVVAKELGHKSYVTTEKYQRCEEHMLKDDFPSLKHLIESIENVQEKDFSTKKTSTKSYSPLYVSSRQMN